MTIPFQHFQINLFFLLKMNILISTFSEISEFKVLNKPCNNIVINIEERVTFLYVRKSNLHINRSYRSWKCSVQYLNIKTRGFFLMHGFLFAWSISKEDPWRKALWQIRRPITFCDVSFFQICIAYVHLIIVLYTIIQTYASY